MIVHLLFNLRCHKPPRPISFVSSQSFANEAFGYWKVSVERPLRLHSRITPEAIEAASLPS